MYKSDEEIDTLLGHGNNHVKILGLGQDDRSDRTPKARGEKIPLEEKAKIATLASILGIKPVAEMIGRTPGVVGRIAKGKNSQGDPDFELQEATNNIKDRIQDKALKRAEEFLEMLGVQGLDTADAVKAAVVAEKVVNVYDKLAPKVPAFQAGTQVIFYAPRIRESSEYQIIEVEAQNG